MGPRCSRTVSSALMTSTTSDGPLLCTGLRQILSDVIQEVRRSVDQDLDGAQILHGLLTASWLQSLLKVTQLTLMKPVPRGHVENVLSSTCDGVVVSGVRGSSEVPERFSSTGSGPRLQTLSAGHPSDGFRHRVCSGIHLVDALYSDVFMVDMCLLLFSC